MTKIYIVMPAYNAAATIRATLESIPNRERYQILVCDDGSSDDTVAVARGLGLEVLRHARNRGYGANQKTLYNTVLERGAEIICMLHPDNQYDGGVIPKMIELIASRRADFVLGNRLHGDFARLGGMPWWKRLANRFLTGIEARVFGQKLGEFHTGLRAYRRAVLEAIDFNQFSDDFVFDSEMIAAAFARGFLFAEAPVQARYFKEASSINFRRSLKYGLETIKVLWRYKHGYYL